MIVLLLCIAAWIDLIVVYNPGNNIFVRLLYETFVHNKIWLMFSD